VREVIPGSSRVPIPPCRQRVHSLLGLALWAIGSALVLGTALVEAAAPKVQKVLLIGIDGVRPDALKLAHTPYLDGLIRNGAFAYDTQILGERYLLNDTVSAPGWASILTGVWADKHGVHHSTFRGANLGRYPTFLERLKRARPHARTAVFVSCALPATALTP